MMSLTLLARRGALERSYLGLLFGMQPIGRVAVERLLPRRGYNYLGTDGTAGALTWLPTTSTGTGQHLELDQ